MPQVGFINWHKGEQFDVEEYEHYEQVGWWLLDALSGWRASSSAAELRGVVKRSSSSRALLLLGCCA